jgi:peroxiredoxin
MKTLTLKIARSFGLTGIFTLGMAGSALAISEGELLPKVNIKAQDGTTDLEFKGKVTLLNFWATWCQACKVELKEMSTEFASLHARKDVGIHYISLDKEPQKAKAYLEETFGKDSDMVKHLGLDSSFAAADSLSIDSFPMTVILDKNGKVVKVQRGFKEGEASTKNLAKSVETLLQ